MHRLFIHIHYFIEKRKWLFYLSLIAFLVFCLFFARRLKFDEDITRILPRNENTNITAKVLKQLSFNDKITVLLERKNASVDELSEQASVLADSLRNMTKYVKEIEGILPEETLFETYDFTKDHLPYFFSPQELKSVEDSITHQNAAQIVEGHYRQLWNPTSIVTKQFMFSDPYQLVLTAVKKFQNLNISDDFQLINGFLFTKDSSQLLFFIQPVFGGSETENNTFFVEQLQQLENEFNARYQAKASVSFFGSSLIAVANAKQIKHDIWTTVAISTTVLMLLLIFFYRKIWIPLILFIPTIIAGIIGMAFLALVKDSISAISLSIGGILIGITIDYALHILTHYKTNSNIEKLYKDITQPLLMSSTTTAAAFVCLIFVKSNALKDLGVFAAICVLLSAIFSLILIPQLYRPKSTIEIAKSNLIERFAGWSFEKSKVLIFVSCTLILVSFFTFNKVGFDNNLSKLNFIPDNLKAVEKKLEERTSLTDKSIYLVNYGNTLDEALENSALLAEKLKHNKDFQLIKNYTAISEIIPDSKSLEQRAENWNTFWNAQRTDSLRNAFEKASSSVGLKKSAYDKFFNNIDNYQTLSIGDFQNLKSIPIRDFISESNGFYTVSTLVKVDHDSTERFVQQIKNSKKLVVVDRQEMNENFLGQLKDDFNNLINYSTIAVFVILFLFFRRIELVLIASVPILLTALVTAGIMGMLHIEFNIFSLIVTTLVFGHGVDFSIFMTSALQKKQTTGEDDLRIFRTSILLAVLTTILAIGALIFAKHPALVSISSISLVGVSVAVLITFVFYPLLFNFFIQNRTEKGKSPATLLVFVNSLISFFYYGFGSLILTFFAAIYIYLLPGNRNKKKYHFQVVMSKFFYTVMRSVPFAKLKVSPYDKKIFDEPAIIIANHTSFLDTLSVGMLSPKIKFLVNDWVYNSPFFGWAVKILGFYPASHGVEGGVEHLRPLIEQGYSFVVFPEGTRSYTNDIQRFHKGAFYLAEKLNLPILPIYIHGQSEALPKGDFMIYHEKITIVIGEKIPRKSLSGKEIREQAKYVSKLFKSRFRELRNELEDADYFKNIVLLSNLFKEQETRDLAKADFEANAQRYLEINRCLPTEGRIAVIGEEIGNLAYLLGLDSPKRRITSYIENEEHCAIATYNYLTVKYELKFENRKIERSEDFIAHSAEFDFIISLKKGLSFEAFETVEKGNGFTIYSTK